MMKDLVMDVAKEMPNNATIEEIFDAIIVRLSAIKGFEEIDKGKYTTQEELLEEIKSW